MNFHDLKNESIFEKAQSLQIPASSSPLPLTPLIPTLLLLLFPHSPHQLLSYQCSVFLSTDMHNDASWLRGREPEPSREVCVKALKRIGTRAHQTMRTYADPSQAHTRTQLGACEALLTWVLPCQPGTESRCQTQKPHPKHKSVCHPNTLQSIISKLSQGHKAHAASPSPLPFWRFSFVFINWGLSATGY